MRPRKNGHSRMKDLNTDQPPFVYVEDLGAFVDGLFGRRTEEGNNRRCIRRVGPCERDISINFS